MRLIDADALKSVFSEWLSENSDYRTIPQIIDGAPTIDAEPVVRCKDCRERCPESATSVQHCTLSGIQTEDDDFCSYGVKMDGGTEC